MSKFSGAVVLGDLNDFISPSQACVKPVKAPTKTDNGNSTIKIENGNYIEVMEDGREAPLKTAQITLNDCLACSGCVTSAETVLIQMQSQEEVYKVLHSNQRAQQEGRFDDIKIVVVSVSPQSRANFAAKYNQTLLQVAKKLTNFFKGLGCHFVFDTSFSRDLALLESQAEFVTKFRQNQSLPMLASACPGWICYAEKTHGSFILPYISSTKSPQQIMGTLVKEYFAKRIGKRPDQIYHITIMPCYDKKLEASRDDFYNDVYKTRDVDCVITTVEVEKMMAEKGASFLNLMEAPLDTMFTRVKMEGNEEILLGHSGGGSGGYLESIFRHAAKELFGVNPNEIVYKIIKNNDFKEVTLEIEGKTVLRFAAAYGFRNIQNLVRKIKTKTCQYHFVEIMACPSGCLNGGGQLKPAVETVSAKEFLQMTEKSYEEIEKTLPEHNPFVYEVYQPQELIHPYSERAQKYYHTSYHAVEKNLVNPLAVQW